MTAWSHSLKGIKVNGGIKIRFIKGIHKGLDRRLTDTDLVCNVMLWLYPLFRVVPFLILPLGVKFTP